MMNHLVRVTIASSRVGALRPSSAVVLRGQVLRSASTAITTATISTAATSTSPSPSPSCSSAVLDAPARRVVLERAQSSRLLISPIEQRRYRASAAASSQQQQQQQQQQSLVRSTLLSSNRSVVPPPTQHRRLLHQQHAKHEHGSEEHEHGSESRAWSIGVASAFGASYLLSTSALADEKEAAPSPSPDQDKPKDDAKPATLMEQLNQFVDGLKETWDTLYFFFYNPSHYLMGYTLLPEPLQPGVPTLVIDINDLLYIETGPDGQKRALKRPGIDEFLEIVASYYEVILWCSNENSMLDGQNAKKLNEAGYFSAILWYPDLTMGKGKAIKDLGRLNRDLSRVVLIASDDTSGEMQPDNAVIIPKWTGDLTDTTLIDLALYMQYMGMQPDDADLRVVMQQFRPLGPDLLRFWREEKERQASRLRKLEERKSTVWGRLFR